MGTSKSYKGPPGRSPLLPPWAPDLGSDDAGDIADDSSGDNPGLDGDEEGGAGDGETAPTDSEAATSGSPTAFVPVSPSVTWRSPNGFASRLARSPGSPDRGRHRNVGRAFVRALGGSRQAARSAPAARVAARRLGSFLSSVAREGIVATAERFGFATFLGGGVNALLAALVRTFAPAGADVESAAALRASVKTFVELLGTFDVEANGAEALDRLTEADVRGTMERFVANCVTERLLQALAGKIETEAVSATRAKEVQDELRGFVRANVALEFGATTLVDMNWSSVEATALIDRLFEGGYAVLEAST